MLERSTQPQSAWSSSPSSLPHYCLHFSRHKIAALNQRECQWTKKVQFFEVIELKGSTTTLCYGDAAKEKITKKHLPERGLWSSAPLLSRSAIFVANPIAAMTIDLEKLAMYVKDIWNKYIFCQYLPIYLCQYLLPTYPQQLPKLAGTH